jgi:hypothetical protein
MRQGVWRNSPALVVSVIALFVALGGSVYAAKQAKIDGKAIKTKSIPGDRLRLRSIAANRLKPGVLGKTTAIHTPLTGTDINELTLGQVPSAAHADTADTAQSAVDAQTALNAVNAIEAQTINGHTVGCLPGTLLFASGCWEAKPSEALSAPVAASKCTERGAELPEALTLAAFAKQPGITLSAGNEWSSDLTTFSGPNAYAVVIVSAQAVLDTDLSTKNHPYRCVLPLLH